MRRTVPSNRPAPKSRRPVPKRRTGNRLFPLILFLAALPGFFVAGMVSGEIAKSMASSHVVDDAATDAPAAVETHPEDLKLDVSTQARVAVIDPGTIRLELARGWQQEQTAFKDTSALIYFSGPFFEEHKGDEYYANAIGDLYYDDQLQLASEISRAFADRRYYMALTRSGAIEFGFGGWKSGNDEKYAAFIGGLGYLFNEDGPAPGYIDPYSGLKQELHNMIPRERLLVGRDSVGHLIVMKTLPLPLNTASWLAKSHGMVEAYYLDQGNKARFIVPGKVDDSPRYNLPYMLRISDKSSPPQATTPAPLSDLQIHHHRRRRPKHAIATPAPDPNEQAIPQKAPQDQSEATPEPDAVPTPGQIDEPVEPTDAPDNQLPSD